MKNLKRTDLACERDIRLQSDYHITVEDIYGIEAICSYHKLEPHKKNIILPVGRVWLYNDEIKRNAALAIANRLKFLKSNIRPESQRVLIVGLGNKHITSDSLGTLVIDELFPTSAIKEYKSKIFTISPGIEGQSGISTFDAINSAAHITSAEVLLVIDSLCAHNIDRLLTTVQLSTEGIMPGSGVGNHKKEISYATVGIPIISIGVPTVTDIGPNNDNSDSGFNYYVSPYDIDLSLKGISKIIAKAVENAFYL